MSELTTNEKLYKVFKDGYRPSRIKQSYYYIIKRDNGVDAYPARFLNCLAHAFFNPTNEVLRDYGFTNKDDAFGDFDPYKGCTAVFADILHFVRDIGLKVEECGRKKPITQFGSWKVDAYFRPDNPVPDYHFMLQESFGIYSHKCGYWSNVEILCSAPKEYNNYRYRATYLITNVNADENNKYNKPLELHDSFHIFS